MLYENYDKAIHDAKTILKRDPLSFEAYWQLGLCYYLGRRYNEAITSFNAALELNPNYSEAYRGIGASYLHMAMYDKSISALEKALELSKGQGPAVMDLLAVLGASGQHQELRSRLDNFLVIREQYPIPAIIFAVGYAYLGDMDKAFNWLEQTYKERFSWLLSLKAAPDWDVFRKDPRFEKFVTRMNFPE